MRVNGKHVSDLTADDITALLGQSESQEIDFKTIGYEGGSWRQSWLKTSSEWPNASGGVILIGIDEQNEQVVGWPGIALENAGKDPMEKYQRSLRDRVEPPVYGTIIRPIDIGNGKHVVAIGIPAGFGRPHRVKITGDGSGRGRWAIRRERDTVDMTYDEIRASFLGAAQADSKVREFHSERVALLQRTWSTVQGYGGVMVLHVVPIGFPKGQLDVQKALMLRDFFQPPGENPGFVGLFADFDGVSGRVAIGQEGESTGWVKVYRNGIVEGVKGHYTALDGMPGDRGRRHVFNHCQFELSVRAAVPAYIDGLMKLGFDPPFAISLTLFNGPPATIDQIGGHRRQIEHSIATLEPGLVETAVSGGQYDTQLHPMFDQLWNAFGMPRALSYDDDGVWRGIPGPVNTQRYR